MSASEFDLVVIGGGIHGEIDCPGIILSNTLILLLTAVPGSGFRQLGLVLLVLGVVGVHGCIISHMYTPHFTGFIGILVRVIFFTIK